MRGRQAVWMALVVLAGCRAKPAGPLADEVVALPLSAWSHAQAVHATVRVTNGDIDFAFAAPDAFVDVAPQALGLSDVSRLRSLTFALEGGAQPEDVTVAALSDHGAVASTRSLGGGHTAVLELGLEALPLANSSPTWRALKAVRVSSKGAPGRMLRVRGVRAVLARAPLPLVQVDSFGQARVGMWPGKVKVDADLTSPAEAQAPQTRPRDDYGGWTAGELWQDSGHFSLERDGAGRDWLVDPRGRPFLSFGVNDVGPTGPLSDPRSAPLLDTVPARGSAQFRNAVAVRGGVEGVAFYRWNVIRAFGDVPPWRERALRRLDAWGFTSLEVDVDGGDPDLFAQRLLPHVRVVHTLKAGEVTDVFDPRFAAHAEAQVASAVAGDRDNPWIVGFVVDEPRWDNIPPVRLEAYADAYFAAVARAMAAHAPHHLYLGARVPVRAPEPVLRAAGRHAHALSVRADDGPTPVLRAALDRVHQLAGKPIILTLGPLPVLDPRQPAARLGSVSASSRTAAFERAVADALAVPYVVGVHAPAYVDDPVSGRIEDGRRDLTGLVDVTDRPHADLVAAVRAASERIYEQHANSH